MLKKIIYKTLEILGDLSGWRIFGGATGIGAPGVWGISGEFEVLEGSEGWRSLGRSQVWWVQGT